MNHEQMAVRCPDAYVVETVRLEGYRLAFCGQGRGVATILPEQGSHVDGVLWAITPACEERLNHYEGYPYLYKKESVTVLDLKGKKCTVMAYVMNAPHKDYPARPSDAYLLGILEGCRQNALPIRPVLDAVSQVAEVPQMNGQRRERTFYKNRER